VGVLLSIILIACKVAVEKTDFGEQLEQMTYNMLQARLLSSRSSKDLKVAVVDINDLPLVQVNRGNRVLSVTPRKPLREIVEAVVQQNPEAIGIDVDFSPDEHGFVTQEDPDFFQFCLNQHIPIFLGVYESLAQGPDKWLGQPEFKQLAAYITVPKPQGAEGAVRMVERIQPAGVSQSCPSLAAALANTLRPAAPHWLGWAIVRVSQKRTSEFSASEFLIDYSGLETLVRDRVPVSDATDLSKHENTLQGKLVLIGRATPEQTSDQFVVPGRGEPVQGVYIHASAAYTLLEAPLYRMTQLGRLSADLLVSLAVFGTIAVIRWLYSRRTRSELATHRMHLVLTSLAVVTVIVLGHFLVQTTRLMWTDFLLVIGALLIHSPAERLFYWLRSTIPIAWHSIILEDAKPGKGEQ
jgi:CHASE2 domain-containing sensor protein